jgi:glycosyltransferase involved in cell wall biosynthesis
MMAIAELSYDREWGRKPQSMEALNFPCPSVSVVIPAKNEAENLPYVLPRIPTFVSEVVLVDGKSTDDTVAVAKHLRPDIRIVEQKGRGKGDALRLGFEAAKSDVIVMLDADGSMAPEEIPAYVGALVSGADYAKGSRFIHGGGTDDMEFHRYLGNLGFVMAVRVLFGGYYSDLCYGYCGFWSHVLPRLGLRSTGFEIETEMNVRALLSGIKVTEVPSFESKRVNGTSNLHAVRDGLRILHFIMKERLAEGISLSRGVKTALSEDTFTPAMKLLIQEAAQLAIRRSELSPRTYHSNVAVIKAAFSELINMEIDNIQVRRQQDMYRRQRDTMWHFLEPKSRIH